MNPKSKTRATSKKRKAIQVHNAVDYFDPFAERKLKHPTTDGETLIHLLKASLGTGILAMPQAFYYAGLLNGIIATILVSIVCTYCSYILVRCAHTHYWLCKVTKMSYADVAEIAFANGPQWSRKFAGFIRQIVLGLLFFTYFGTCSVYTVIIAENFQQVLSYHIDTTLSIKVYIGALLIPLLLLSYVPNLKYLAPVSWVANILMAVGLGITFFYLIFLDDVPNIQDREWIAPLDTWPKFFCLTVFAMEAIGVVMPLENNMETPRHFLGSFGVLNIGMTGVTIIYIFLGFFGYLKYGKNTSDSITLNLPTNEIKAQVAKICISLAVFCTYGLQFFVCLEIAWDKIEEYFKNVTNIHNYILRTTLVTLTVVLAVAVPTIGPFITLIGALCFSLLGIIMPVIIEFTTYSKNVSAWMAMRNVMFIVVGILALVFGTKDSIKDILAKYKQST